MKTASNASAFANSRWRGEVKFGGAVVHVRRATWQELPTFTLSCLSLCLPLSPTNRLATTIMSKDCVFIRDALK